MSRYWRWIDTGLRGAAENLALGRALLEACQAGAAPATLHFLRFTPSALVGRHGVPARELDLAWCRAQAVAVQRRISGGGAIYMDPGVLGWQLTLARGEAGTADARLLGTRACEAVAAALAGFGVAARVRAPGDVVVGERKISGSGGAVEGEALLCQGTLLLDFDCARMARALRAPAQDAGLVDLRTLLGAVPEMAFVRRALLESFARQFDARFAEGCLDGAEQRLFETALAGMSAEEWIRQAEAFPQPA